MGFKECLLVLILLEIVGCKNPHFFLTEIGNEHRDLKENLKSEIVTFESTEIQINQNLSHKLDSIVLIKDIIVIGEPTHYGSGTNNLRFELIKYLHENHQFNVLLIEGDFFALNSITDSFTDKRSYLNNITYSKALPLFWDSCAFSNTLFNSYIPKSFKSKNPLVLNGFDPQFYSDFSSMHFGNYLCDMFGVYDSTNLLRKLLLKNPWHGISYEEREFLKIQVNEMKIKCEVMNLENTEVYQNLSNYDFILKNADTSIDISTSIKLRDDQMARKVDYLVNHKFKGKKIVVLAHNTHIARNSNLLYKNYENMISQFVNDSLNNLRVFTIGITSRNGTFGGLGSEVYAIPEHPYGFELLFPKNVNYAFIETMDIPENIKSKRFLAGFDNHIPTWSNWYKNFDGIFYIKTNNDCGAQ